MKTTLIFLCGFFLLTVSSCTKQAGPRDNKTNYIHKAAQDGSGFTFYTDNSIYNNALQQRNSAYNDANYVGRPFDITGVKRVGDTLIVSVSYSSTCSMPKFLVIWDGAVLMTYPYTINLAMSLSDSSCSDSTTKTSEDIKIDLSKYIGDFATDANTYFLVHNICDQQNVSYPIHN